MTQAGTPSPEPFRREHARPEESVRASETKFERERGIDRVEVKGGFATVSVGPLVPPFEQARLDVLRRVAQQGVSVDYLKLDGPRMSFVVSEPDLAALAAGLEGLSFQSRPGRCVVAVHAANMRDEEGLIARTISRIMLTGDEVDHIGDMHDRVIFVLDTETAERVKADLGGDQ